MKIQFQINEIQFQFNFNSMKFNFNSMKIQFQFNENLLQFNEFQFNEIHSMKKLNLDSKKVCIVIRPVENHFRLVTGSGSLYPGYLEY